MAARIMILGYGSTGKYVLDMATKMREFSNCCFHVVSRTEREEAEKRINITRVSSGIFDFYPAIEYHSCDINDVDRMSELITITNPDIIAYTGRYIKGFKYGEFSYPNDIGYGVWSPMAVVLVEKVMRAVKASGTKTQVINTSYGDVVSPALAAVDLAPLTSAGNLNHLIPRMKLAYANLTGDNIENVDVTFVGSHYANTYISKEGTCNDSPYLLHIAGQTKKSVSDEEIFKRCALPTISGPERNWMIASDVIVLMRLLLDKSGKEEKTHAPGPFGLAGGYPLLFKDGHMSLDETYFKADDMISVNKQNLEFDGVSEISANGITFTDNVIKRMKDIFNIKYPRTVSVEDCEEFATHIAETLMAVKK